MFLLIFAGQTNMSSVLCWFLIILSQHTSWQEHVHFEVDQLMEAHASDPTVSITDALSNLSLHDWEHSLPTLDKCLHEAMRLTFNGINVRRNVGEDIYVDGHRIRQGDYLMYLTADAHLDPELYPDPSVFNPDRCTVKSSERGLLAWGTGAIHKYD